MLLMLASSADRAVALDPPPAVTEYDFGGPGPVGDLQFGGRTTAVDINPFDNTKAITAADSGGLWRTSDGGLTWSRVDSFPQFRMEDVRYDPSDPNTIIATSRFDGRTTPESGIWRSTDNGATWSRAAVAYGCVTEPNAWGIGMVAGGDSHQKIFAANDCGVAYSDDSGSSWTQTGPSVRFFDVTAVRTGVDTALAYACTESGRVYSTTVSGAATPTWTLESTVDNVSGDPGRCQVEISPLDTDVVFLTNRNCPQAGACNNSTFGMRLFESDDGGNTFVDLPGPLTNNRPGAVVTSASLDGDANHYELFWGNGLKFYRQHCDDNGAAGTVDCPVVAESGAQCSNAVDDDSDQIVNEGCPTVGPKSEDVNAGECKNAVDDDGDGFVNDGCEIMERFDIGTHVDPTDIAFDPTAVGAACALLSSNDGGLGRSTNCGTSWSDSNAGLNALQIYTVFGTLRGPGPTETDIYFGTHDNEWWYSLDNGGTWTRAFCCEGFQGQVDYRVPPGGLSDIRATFVNCAGCSNQTAERGFANRTDWPNPPGGGWGGPARVQSVATLFGNQRWAQVSTDLGTPPNFQLYIMQPETGSDCDNAIDDDLDTGLNDAGAGAVNDGCPATGAAESGVQCHNAVDDDGDTRINDGCSHIFSPESGGECGNATDDDGDNVVNDGCPKSGATSESGAQCLDSVDANEDGAADAINDGCPEVGVWGPMGPAMNEAAQAPLVVAGPATGPTFYFRVDLGGDNRELRKIAGPMNASAILSDAGGTGTDTLDSVRRVGRQFWFPGVYAVDPNNPLHLYAADHDTEEMKFTTDGGTTWNVDDELTSLVTGNGEFEFRPWHVQWDPEDSDRILVGTELAGVIASVNGGEDWFTVRGSENEMHITNGFFFDNEHELIYASTWGRGIWTIELPEADLSVSKTDSPDPVTAGEQLFYTITATNNGPEVATVEVVDTLPPEVTFVDDNLAPPLGCIEGPPGELRCDVGVLGVSESITFDVKVQVNTDAVVSTGPKAIFNTVNVRSTDSLDPDTSDNEVTEATFVDDLADLQVTKLCKPDEPALAGAEPGECTIFIDNFGPSDARDVVLTDSNVSNGSFTLFGVTPSQGTCDPPAAGVVTCDLGDIPAGSGVTVVVGVSATSAVDVNDVATVVSDTPDPDPSDNQATGSVTFFEEADLKVTKLCKPDDELLAGETATCTIFVDNLGPSDASSVHLTDVNVSNGAFSFGSISASQGSCDPPAAGVVECDLGTIAAMSPTESGRATVVIEITATEAMDINDVATVVSSTFDPDLSNNQAEDGVSVTAVSDLALVKTATPEPVIAGEDLTYTLTVTNNGPSTVVNVLVDDALPLGVSIISVSGTGGASCVAGQPGNPLLRTSCAFDSLAPGASETMTVIVTVDPSVLGIIHNDARVVSDVFDPDNSDDFASENTTVNAEADLSISKTDFSDPVVAGTPMTYELTVVNNGPSDAVGVVVEDALPNEVVFQSATISNGAGTCVLLAVPPNTVSCQLDTVAPNAGSPVLIYIDVLVKADTPDGTVLTNDSSVTSSTTDPDGGNNTSSQDTDVNAVADLQITKTSDLEIYSPKETIVYTIEVTNLGPSDAQDVEVVDVLPLSPDTKKVVYQFDNGGCTLDADTNVLTCPQGMLAAGATVSFEVHIDVKGELGLITNDVTVSTTTFDPNLANNAASKDVLVEGSNGNKGSGNGNGGGKGNGKGPK
jgi:uncharacterized repeat protein (TIGR01451 family)